jgi:recombination protein RecA
MSTQEDEGVQIAKEAEFLRQLGPPMQWLSTGCTILDLAIADQLPGGFPGGRISHIYGKASTAKTVIVSEPLGSAQRQGGKAFFRDAEFTFDFDRAALFGVDVTDEERWSYGRPSTIENLFDGHISDAVDGLEEEGPPSVMAIDSLSALPSKAEEEAKLEDVKYGTSRAKQLSTAFRKYIWKLNQKNLAVIFVDQSRVNITKTFGDKETVSGGEALKFYASTRIQLKHKGDIKNRFKKAIGINIGFKVVKNKVAPPFRSGEFRLLFDVGIDDIGSNLDWLKESRCLVEKMERKPATWFFDEQHFKTLDLAIKHVEDNDMEALLRQQVWDVWKVLYTPVQRKPKRRFD